MVNCMQEILGTGHCLVDLGCGSGELLRKLGVRFKQRIGLDVSMQRLELAPSGPDPDWRFQEADLNAVFPLANASADAVIANQVIEHIIDPVHFASEIYRVLRPGGRCVITTPNIRYLKHIMHLLLSGYGPRTAGSNTRDGTWDDGHIHYFTHRDLRELLTSVGFRRLESRALINLTRGGWLRHWLDRHASSPPIREFFSGCILLWAEK